MELQELLTYPESSWLDWKRQFPRLEEDRDKLGIATVLKDLVAIANTDDDQPEGYLVYGVADNSIERTVVGIGTGYDDARFQQMARNVFEPVPQFLYHEEERETLRVGIFAIRRVPDYPHVVKRSIGGVLEEGQVYFRQGSQNRIAGQAELKAIFMGKEPFKFQGMSDPEYKRITAEARTQGLTISVLYLSNRDSYLAQGYKPLYFPGTRREIWVGYHNGEYELMVFVVPEKPKN